MKLPSAVVKALTFWKPSSASQINEIKQAKKALEEFGTYTSVMELQGLSHDSKAMEKYAQNIQKAYDGLNAVNRDGLSANDLKTLEKLKGDCESIVSNDQRSSTTSLNSNMSKRSSSGTF